MILLFMLTYDFQHCKVAPKGLYLPLHELVDGFLVRMSATVSGALIRHLPDCRKPSFGWTIN